MLTRVEKYKKLRLKIQAEIQMEVSANKNKESVEDYRKKLLRVDPDFFNVSLDEDNIDVPSKIRKYSLSLARGHNVKQYLYDVNKSELIHLIEDLKKHQAKFSPSANENNFDVLEMSATEIEKKITDIISVLERLSNDMEIDIQTEVNNMDDVLQKIQNSKDIVVDKESKDTDATLSRAHDARILSSREVDISQTLKRQISESAHGESKKNAKIQYSFAILLVVLVVAIITAFVLQLTGVI